MTSKNGAKTDNKKTPINLPVISDDEEELDGDTYIVVGEAGDDVAFELCEDEDTALEVRALMIEDGFSVKMYLANELEVVEEEASK
jgi:hypothetical protein